MNKISSTPMTYEQLMNSHFMKHPTHSKLVHTIFSPWFIMFIIMIPVGTMVYMIDGDVLMTVLTTVICGGYAPAKLMLATSQIEGNGVGLTKRGKVSLLGLPTVPSVIFLVLLAIILLMNWVAFTAPGGGFERMQLLSVSFLFSFIMSLLSWRFHMYYETWYGSEYSARMEFKDKGYDDETINMKIAKLKKCNIIRS